MPRPFAHLTTLPQRVAACRSGSAAVEMGIVLPFLIMAIVGTIYMGWLMFSVNVMFYAVEQAARCAAVNAAPCKAVPGGASQVAQTQAVAASLAIGLNVTAAQFNVTSPAVNGNGCWGVSYNYSFNFLVPFGSDFTVTFPASACYPAQPT